MRVLQRFIFPALYGLMVYISIRLVNDSMSRTQFIDRSWQQNTIEILATMLSGILFNRILRGIISTAATSTTTVSLKIVRLEFGKVFLAVLLIFNPVLFIIHYLIKQPVKWNDFIIFNLLVTLFVLLHYSLVRGFSLIRLYILQSTEIEHLKNEQLTTELKFLKAQYHPHFLFNALNTIYFQMDDSVEDAKKTLENFAELLRYQLYQHHDMVGIEMEVKYLQNFIQLQKTRASEKMQLTVNFDPTLNGEKIHPLLLLPLVENAFKYVNGDYRLDITLFKDEDWLVFRIDNSVNSSQPASNGGIGLENLKRRLQLLYPAKHSITAQKENNVFRAMLKIRLQ